MADHEQQEPIEETPFAELPVDAAPAEEHGEAADAGAIEEGTTGDREDEGPVHRRLIRATLPRPEGQPPERKGPEFTMRQPGAGNPRHGRGRRGARGPQGSFNGPMRFGSGSHQNQAQSRQRQNGNRPASSGNQRGGRPQGQQRGPGRKRGR